MQFNYDDLFDLKKNQGILAVLYSESGLQFVYFDLLCLHSSMLSFDSLRSFLLDEVKFPFVFDFEFYPCFHRLLVHDFRKFPLTVGYFRGRCTRNLMPRSDLRIVSL